MSDPTFDQIPEQALAWHRAGKGAALATVIETWGSAPRRTGSQLAINGAGEIMGSVSGGCVEGAVIVEAIDAISDGDARELEFGVSDGDAFAVGLACGGTIRILIEPIGTVLPEPLLAELTAARANRTPAAYVVDLDTGSRHLATTGHETRFALDRSGFEPDSRCFIAIHNPPLRLTVVGAVHIAQALLPMAQMTGYDPVLIDPRESFATAARFPGQTIRHDSCCSPMIPNWMIPHSKSHWPRMPSTSAPSARIAPMPNAQNASPPRASRQHKSRASTALWVSTSAPPAPLKLPSRSLPK
jgi:xanthine dehydrogenase accessory factor